jgi:hypothetical protein
MLFHASGSFAVVEQPKRRLPPLRSVLSFGDFVRMKAISHVRHRLSILTTYMKALTRNAPER